MASYAARTTDLSSHAYLNFNTEVQLDLAVEHFVSGLRNASTRDYLRRKRARRITWKEAVQITQACELPRASDRSNTHAAIVSDTSSTTFANSAQNFTTSRNNYAITPPCATGNSSNTRRRHKYSTSLRAPQGDWRAAYPGNTVDPPSYLWNFDPITGAPTCTPPNTQTPNPASVYGGYQRAPFVA